MARILVVEDDPDLLDSVEALLQAEGYEVARARNGLEALHAVQGTPPDLILLDLMMPVMDDWQFLEAFRKSGLPQVPVVVLSAAVGASGRMKTSGVRAFLSKPFDVSHLVQEIRQATLSVQ